VSVADRLSKPQYVYRPIQLVRRALLARQTADEVVVQTPWGSPLLVSRSDVLGAGIARMGVHELPISELIWRLSDGDDLALDVGANVGYFAGLLARRTKHVIAFEPNPALHRFIAGNIARWGAAGERVSLDVRAASDHDGTASLNLPQMYSTNLGTATLEAAEGIGSNEVRTVRLDDVIAGRQVGLLKIDVEGHELSTFHGASESLAAGLIRDIVFEDLQPLPSEVSRLLETAGYTIKGIEETFTRTSLVPPAEMAHGWDAPTYLATLDLARAERLMAPRGWRCLRGRS
jgi:FkbM family methyltransferase